MLCKVTHCAGRILANTKPAQNPDTKHDITSQATLHWLMTLLDGF